jgi:hypothetical protein
MTTIKDIASDYNMGVGKVRVYWKHHYENYMNERKGLPKMSVDLPRTSNDPIVEDVVLEFRASLDAALEEKRQRLMTQPGARLRKST